MYSVFFLQFSQDEVITQLLLFNMYKFLHEFSGFQISNHAYTTKVEV